ncbi:glycosyltransferase family 2 protein [Candidatus Bathyarchaeota archaeon]|nr:glycosyltransferase family 2 protein [Candidatus Bathyarchaeota archaeon]
MKTTIIVPTYNEAENIPELVWRIRASMDGVRILVVDDSPGDETAVAAWRAGCAVVKRLRNRGLSRAVIEGIEIEKDAEFIIVMDADLQHPPEVLPEIIENLKKADFVIPSRYIKNGGCREWGLKRRIISRVSNLLAAPLVKFKVKDLSSGFFGFERSKVDTKVLQAEGFKIMLELLIKGNWQRITEIPYTFEPRLKGKSKLDSSKITAYLRQLASLYFYKFRWIKFGLVGLVGSAVQFPILYGLTEVANMPYLASATVATVFAATSNYTLNNLWTFGDRQKDHNLVKGLCKYLAMAGLTYPAYIGLLYMLTDFAGMWYMMSSALSIIIMFVVNYTVSKRWIWNKAEEQQPA